ncbi:hypothetical protein [Shewanella algae]|uniref:hypothetical protein n=1 Tax=Shewanella TaxID=22 RepID=UPI0031F51BD3
MGAFKVVDAKPFSSEARKAVIYKYFYHLSAFRRFAANYESEKELKKGLAEHMKTRNKTHNLGLDTDQLQVDLLVMVQSLN